eukprot:1137619-Pelagomonas_calceolata.AAC.4
MGAASRTASTSLHQRHFTFQCVRADFKNVSIVGHYIKDRTKNAQEKNGSQHYRPKCLLACYPQFMRPALGLCGFSFPLFLRLPASECLSAAFIGCLFICSGGMNGLSFPLFLHLPALECLSAALIGCLFICSGGMRPWLCAYVTVHGCVDLSQCCRESGADATLSWHSAHETHSLQPAQQGACAGRPAVVAFTRKASLSHSCHITHKVHHQPAQQHVLSWQTNWW